jgi:hypothetical protein
MYHLELTPEFHSSLWSRKKRKERLNQQRPGRGSVLCFVNYIPKREIYPWDVFSAIHKRTQSKVRDPLKDREKIYSPEFKKEYNNG